LTNLTSGLLYKYKREGVYKTQKKEVFKMRKIFNGVITGVIFAVLQGIGILTNRKNKKTEDAQPLPATIP